MSSNTGSRRVAGRLCVIFDIAGPVSTSTKKAMPFMFARLLRPRSDRAAAAQLYLTLVEQARHPDFYARWGVPDTTTGRFDLIALHAFLVMHRLKAAGTAGQDMSQALFDYMFADMDLSLREMGVGDLSVGKKIKKMAEGFNGRAMAFEEALGDPSPLREALTRNLFGTATPLASNVDAIGRYVERESPPCRASRTRGCWQGP